MVKNKAGILFLISPVLGLVEALQSLKGKQARTVLFWFCLCFGICFTVGTERIEGSMDGISMRAEFEESKNLTTSQYISYLTDYFEFDMGDQDIYIVTVSYIVGKFTDNYHFFFMVLAFVFAFFQLKCLRYFVSEENYTNSAICIILVCLFLWNNIYNINGARFWTASWIGLYCAFRTFIDEKPWYILLSTVTLFIHVAFVVFPLVLFLAYLVRRADKMLLALFCISWVFSLVAEDFKINPFGDIDLPFLVEKKVEAYTEGDFAGATAQGSGYYWVQQLFRSIVRHYVDLLILIIGLNRKANADHLSNSIVSMMLVLATVANFGMIIPTFGGRFFAVNYALVAYSFLTTFGDKKYRMMVYLLPFVWFMNLFYLSSDVISVLDLGFLLSPIFSFIRFTFFA
jgi:hypothetical protein